MTTSESPNELIEKIRTRILGMQKDYTYLLFEQAVELLAAQAERIKELEMEKAMLSELLDTEKCELAAARKDAERWRTWTETLPCKFMFGKTPNEQIDAIIAARTHDTQPR